MSKRTASVLTFGHIHWLSSDSLRIWKAHAWVNRKPFFQIFLSFAQQDQHQSLQRPPHLNMLKQRRHARVWTPRSVFACSPSGPTSTTTQQPSSSPSRSSINGKRKSEDWRARISRVLIRWKPRTSRFAGPIVPRIGSDNLGCSRASHASSCHAEQEIGLEDSPSGESRKTNKSSRCAGKTLPGHGISSASAHRQG